ncbi:MAG: hypothetical protein V4530_10995 [Pseudomonadota bacterium]
MTSSALTADVAAGWKFEPAQPDNSDITKVDNEIAARILLPPNKYRLAGETYIANYIIVRAKYEGVFLSGSQEEFATPDPEFGEGSARQ